MPHFYFHLRTPAGLERDAFGLDRPSLEAAYLEACRTIPDLCVDLLHEGIAPLACSFLICDAADAELLEVPFGERLHDGCRPGRPSPLPEQLACLAEIRKGRRLGAEMRAHIADMRVSAAQMRETARQSYPLLGAIGRTEV
ncbi:DUF6894 family protein [Methylobacterium sp. CM6257]